MSAYPRKGGGHAVVGRDPSKPGRWRVTFIDADGEPVGHIEAADEAGAMREAHFAGALLPHNRSTTYRNQTWDEEVVVSWWAPERTED